MKAEWIANSYHGWSFRVGDTTYATVYPNNQSFDVYLTGNLFNPEELPSAHSLPDAQMRASRAILDHLRAKVQAVEAMEEEHPK